MGVLLALALLVTPTSSAVLDVGGHSCRDGLLKGPERFSVWVFCEDALGTHVGVIYAQHMTLPSDGAWSLSDRFFQQASWAHDVETLAWGQGGMVLFVSTSGVYGTGALYQLDLLQRRVHTLLEGDTNARVEIIRATPSAVQYRVWDLTTEKVRSTGTVHHAK